jgi:hypothetical protein
MCSVITIFPLADATSGRQTRSLDTANNNIPRHIVKTRSNPDRSSHETKREGRGPKINKNLNSNKSQEEAGLKNKSLSSFHFQF